MDACDVVIEALDRSPAVRPRTLRGWPLARSCARGDVFSCVDARAEAWATLGRHLLAERPGWPDRWEWARVEPPGGRWWVPKRRGVPGGPRAGAIDASTEGEWRICGGDGGPWTAWSTPSEAGAGYRLGPWPERPQAGGNWIPSRDLLVLVAPDIAVLVLGDTVLRRVPLPGRSGPEPDLEDQSPRSFLASS